METFIFQFDLEALALFNTLYSVYKDREPECKIEYIDTYVKKGYDVGLRVRVFVNEEFSDELDGLLGMFGMTMGRTL